MTNTLNFAWIHLNHLVPTLKQCFLQLNRRYDPILFLGVQWSSLHFARPCGPASAWSNPLQGSSWMYMSLVEVISYVIYFAKSNWPGVDYTLYVVSSVFYITLISEKLGRMHPLKNEEIKELNLHCWQMWIRWNSISLLLNGEILFHSIRICP